MRRRGAGGCGGEEPVGGRPRRQQRGPDQWSRPGRPCAPPTEPPPPTTSRCMCPCAPGAEPTVTGPLLGACVHVLRRVSGTGRGLCWSTGPGAPDGGRWGAWLSTRSTWTSRHGPPSGARRASRRGPPPGARPGGVTARTARDGPARQASPHGPPPDRPPGAPQARATSWATRASTAGTVCTRRMRRFTVIAP